MTGGFKLNGGFQTFFPPMKFQAPIQENHRKIYYHDAGRQGRNPGNTLLSIGFCMPGMIWRTAHCKTEDVKRMFWITSLRTTACMSLLIRERAWKFLRPWPSFNASQVYSNPLATPEAWNCTIVTQLDPFLRFPYLRHSRSCLVCIRLPKSKLGISRKLDEKQLIACWMNASPHGKRIRLWPEKESTQPWESVGTRKACSELHEEHHTWLKWWSHTTWLEWHSNWVHGTFRGRRKAARKSSEACRNQSWHGCVTGGFVDMAVPHGFPYSYWKNVRRVVHG